MPRGAMICARAPALASAGREVRFSGQIVTSKVSVLTYPCPKAVRLPGSSSQRRISLLRISHPESWNGLASITPVFCKTTRD